MIDLSDETEALVHRIAMARGISIEEAIVRAIEESAQTAGVARPRRRQTAEQMLAVGDEISALPLLDPRSPRDIMDAVNVL
jgi:antitoxin VapB